MLGFNARTLLLAAAILPALSQQTTFNSWKTYDSPWTTFPRPIARVAVIGAGPAGLQAAAHLLDANLTVRLFERAPSPGGNWFYTEETPVREAYPYVPGAKLHNLPATNYYEEGQDGMSLDNRWKEHWQPRPVWSNLHSNAPASFMKLPGIEYPAGMPWSVPVRDLQRHVRAYASLHGLNVNDQPSASPSSAPVTSYSTRVEAIQKCNEKSTWKLTLRRLEWLSESNRLKEVLWTEEFDAVVVATGHFTKAYVPPIKGIGDWSNATEDGRYSIYHSQSFRHPERYTGKAPTPLIEIQTVLVVGASMSATDIARTIAPFTHRLLASVRPNQYRDGYGLDLLLGFPKEAEVVPEIAYFEPLNRHYAGIKQEKIWLKNGSIILATGYLPNDFLPDLVNPQTMGNLHWTGHYIQDPTLAYMLGPRMWTLPGYQSYAFAKVWTGKARLPSPERMWTDYQNKKYRFESPMHSANRRLYVAWLNSESLELGGQFVEPMSLNVREELTYFVNARWKKQWMSHENWTRFDDLPASDWPKPGPPSDGGEYKVVSW
ncbi:FAD/NAD-P-binding domain-containing protein [Mycena polygramma]|nr:FAD/NAD-P-binding domain-containing protein [Mycena polygramma]